MMSPRTMSIVLAVVGMVTLTAWAAETVKIADSFALQGEGRTAVKGFMNRNP